MLIENKQRLVGIIVLVVFVALLIPFLFAGGSGKKDSANINADSVSIPTNTTQQVPQSDSLPPEMISNQSQVIIAPIQNQTQNSAEQIPVQTQYAPSNQSIASTNDMPESVVQSPEDITPAVQPAKQQVILPAQSNTIQDEQQVSGIATVTQPSEFVSETVKENQAVKSNNASMQVKTVVKKPLHEVHVTKAKEKVIYKEAVVKSSTVDYWSVQIGSFADQKHVQKIMKEIRAKGYHVTSEKVKTVHGLLTRVLVGRECTKENADRIATSLENSMKISGKIVRIQK